MKLIKYTFIIALSFFVTTVANAKIVETQANGYGDDYDMAVMNALENAVRQTSEVKISQNAPQVSATAKSDVDIDLEQKGMLNDKSLKGSLNEKVSVKIKMIEATYSGKIKSYEVVSEEKEKNGNFKVRIKAKVDVVEDYKSSDLVTKAKDKLVIMPFKGSNSYRCAGSSISLDKINSSITNKLTNKLSKTRKFSIVDRRNLDNYAQEALLIASDLTATSDKNKIRNIAAADYMIVGTINDFTANTTTERVEVLDETVSKTKAELSVEYSIIEVATTEVIFSESADFTIRKEKGIKNCNKILDELADKITTQISKDSLEAIFPDYEYVAKEKKKAVKPKTIHDTPKQKQVTKLPFDN